MGELVEVVVPEAQEGTQSTLTYWLKQPGDTVEANEPLAELETDKVSVEVPAPASGVLKEVLKQVNDPVEPGELLARIETGAVQKADEGPTPHPAQTPVDTAEPSEVTETPAPAAPPAPSAPTRPIETRLSPAARRLLTKYDLDPETILGTGRDGRITHQDIVDYIERHDIEVTESPRASFEAARPRPEVSDRPSRMVPLEPMRRRIARHMLESVTTAPHVTAVFDADLSAILADRDSQKGALAEKDVKLTLTAYFVKAAVEAIAVVPAVNSRFHDDAIEIFEDCNIGVGTSLEDKGLIVPVIQKAQELDLEQIAARLQDLTSRARSGDLTPEEVRNGTFTISNHGVSGSLFAAPIIINQPQSAILGIGKLEKRVVVVEEDGRDAAKIRSMCYVSLTIDHRVLDGFQTNKFLSKFVDVLQTWGR